MAAEWFEAYDDDTVRVRTRKAVRTLAVGFALASGALVALAPVAALAWPGRAGLVALACGLALTGHALWLIRRIGHVQRAVWRVELSVRSVVAFDAAGRRVALAWPEVERIAVSDAGLCVVGRDAAGGLVRVAVARAFPGFCELGHRAVEYAEAFGRPVWVEGRPWQALDLDALYPFLRGVRAGAA